MAGNNTSKITATEQSWNSATTLYIARKLGKIAESRSEVTKEKPLKVLDMGCGTGNLINYFKDYGHDLYGYDFPDRAHHLKNNLGDYFGEAYDDHIRIMRDERVIPFDDNQFDVIYANQVFEHVRFLDAMIAECARVLKPNGVIIMLFPFATYPFENHSKIPFAHWISPGKTRIRYIYCFHLLHLGYRMPNMTRWESATWWNTYLKEQTYYRFMNEYTSLSDYYFEKWHFDTEAYVEAKLDLLETQQHPLKRFIHNIGRFFQGKRLAHMVTHYFGAVFCMENPK